PHHANSNNGDSSPAESIHKRELVLKLKTLLATHRELIEKRQPTNLLRNRAGYFLRDVLTDTHLNFPRLLVGSEGTLALFSKAVLKTSPLPAARGAMLVSFGTLEGAIRAVSRIAEDRPSACDLLDRRLLTLARETDSRFEKLLPEGVEAVLLVEHVGFSDAEVSNKLSSLAKKISELPDTIETALIARTDEELDFLWSLPNRVVPMLNGVRAETSSPLPIVEDIAIPPAAMEDFVSKMRRVFQRHEVTASLYSHASSGQLHIRPFLPVPGPQDGSRLEALARDLYHAAISVGGSISGEHGLGLSRTAFLRSQYGELYRVFQEVKSIFDPLELLNPNKVLSDDPRLTVRYLRPPVETRSELYDLQLNWTPNEFSSVASSCHGCGGCRTAEPSLRMCPFFRIEPSEELTPRAKANAIRATVDGRLPPHTLGSAEMRQLADKCFNCKQCLLECVNHVDIPHLMIEAKAQHLITNGPATPDWFLSRVHLWGDWLCRFSWIINPLIAGGGSRWLLERLIGVSAQRRLPPFARRSFLRGVGRSYTSPPASVKEGLPVIYFVDHFANFHDPELGLALMRILEHNQIPVHVPPGQVHSGMALITMGDLDRARQLADKNVRVLAEFAREGSPIVCTEPTAAICLKQEYPRLLDNPDSRLVADRVLDAGEYLAGLQRSGRLRTDLTELNLTATYHTPCHLKGLGQSTPLADLCDLIPGFVIQQAKTGCSGMAGTFGISADHFEESLTMGSELIELMRSNQHQLGLTECSSCRMQMEQRTPIPTLHPLKLLALAYGLMPQIHRRLKLNTRKRLTS
ncbi:MAG: oxidase, partial [Planctomycetes bacterium]|nr:oxidase [Planctomycetota bacterium]